MKKLAVAAVVVVAVIGFSFWHHRGSHTADTAATSGSAATATRAERAKAAVPASVSGHVTNATTHAGIPHAVVALSSGGALAGELGVAQPTLTAITDASGAWTATAVPPSEYIVTAAAPGFVPKQTAKLSVASGEAKTGVDLALLAGGTLVSGTVSDIGGGPIEGAHVRFRDDDRFDFDAADFLAITAKDGTYQISLPDGRYQVAASDDEYVTKRENVELSGKPVTQDFVLVPGGTIRGQVIARDSGKPVPFALIHASARHRFEGGGSPNASADAEGKFVVHSLGSGVVDVVAYGRGYASVAPLTVELGIGEQKDGVRVMVDRAYSISGIVVKKGTKEGLPGVHIGVFSMQGGQVSAPDPTDDKGRFEIFGVRPGSYMMFALGEGEVPNIGKQIAVVDKDQEVTLELEVGVTISGRVNPPQEAAITIELAGPVGLANMFEAVKTAMVRDNSDAKTGVFTLKNVPAGAFKLNAHAKLGPVGSMSIVVGAADQKDLLVQLETRAAVSGKVIDTTGAPVPGAEVTASRTDDDHDSGATFSMNGGGRGGVKTALDGSFRIVGLEAGAYELTAVLDDDDFTGRIEKKENKKKKTEVTLAVADDKSGITITMEARNGVIKGQVIGSDKQPAADAWVQAYRTRPEKKDDTDDSFEWSSREPVLTGADGKFAITKLRPGSYKIVADGPHGGSRAEKKDVKTGDSVTIELAPLGTLAGRVTLSGAPVVNYTIDCNGPSNADRTVAAADGAYVMEHIAPGSYRCSISSDAGTANAKVEVNAGNVTQDFTLSPWASVTGTVVSVFDKKPVAGLTAIAGGDNNNGQWADILTNGGPKTDASGRFVAPKVPVGPGTVAVMDATGGFTPLGTKPYTAVDGQRVDVGTIEVVPPRSGDAGTFGMVTETSDKALTVTMVKPGGPAATAGIAVGDTITSIGGRSVDSLGVTLALTYLSSGSIGIGVTLQLGIDRAGTASTVSVTSVKW